LKLLSHPVSTGPALVPALDQFSGMFVAGGRALLTAAAVKGGFFTAHAPRDSVMAEQHMLAKTVETRILIVFLFTAPSQFSDARQ
jgi:hypothetical protein